MKFMYSVIRYVPDPIRGEFVNVGVIAGSDESSEWGLRQVDNPIRARRLDEHGSLPAVWEFMDRVGHALDAFEDEIERPSLEGAEFVLSEDWLADLHVRHRNIVQLSPPQPLLADSVDEALDRTFADLILDPAKRSGSENKHPALAAVRRAYRELGLVKDEHVFERALLHAGQHRERLDFAVANGRVVQLAQTWSFQVADQDALAEQVKAWAWTIKTVKDQGGTLEVPNGRTVDVPQDVDVAVVYVPPAVGQDAPALLDAESVFETLHATRREVSDAQQVAAEAAHRLAGTAATN